MPQVSIPIIDQLVHPSIGLLTRALIAGSPFAGFTALAPPQNPLVALTYGICLRPAVIPPQWGRTGVFPVRYEDGFAFVTSHYIDLSGLDVIKQPESAAWDNYIYFWDEPLPSLVSLDIAVGWSLNLYWMQT